MDTLAIVSVVASALFAGSGFWAWHKAVLMLRQATECLNGAKNLANRPVALPVPSPAPFLAPVRSGRTLVREPNAGSAEAPALFSKEQRREAIAEKANDPEFAERIEKTFRYRTTAHWLPQWKR